MHTCFVECLQGLIISKVSSDLFSTSITLAIATWTKLGTKGKIQKLADVLHRVVASAL